MFMPDFPDFLHPHGEKEENEMDDNAMQKMHRYWVLNGLRQSKENLQNDYDKKDNNRAEYSRQLRYLRLQIVWHYVKNTFLFPLWFIRILTPSFFKGTPNIWTNLKQIFTKKEFHPLRMAMLSWFAFSYLLVQGGMYYFRHAPRAEAATFTYFQTSWSGGGFRSYEYA